jgi:hypothetical protein
MSSLSEAQAKAVRLPGDAFDSEGEDVLGPSVDVLKALNLISDKSQDGVSSAFTGPPDSVAIIEAGATAASKWWAVTGAAAFAGVWASVRTFWNGNSEPNQRVMLIAAAIASAALILAIGYLLASDVRGRAAAMVATIESRARIVEAVTRVARGRDPEPEEAGRLFLALPSHRVDYPKAEAANEAGWTTLAMSTKADGTDAEFFIAKDGAQKWVPAADVKF